MAENREEKAIHHKPISKETIEWLIITVVRLPKPWIIINVLLVILSIFDFSWTGKTGFSLSFQINYITAIFLALMWLPALLKVFALAGGGIKTPAGELTGLGVIDLLQSLDSDTIGLLIEQTDKVEDQVSPKQQQIALQVRQELEQEYVSRVPPRQRYQQIEQLTQRYKEIRTTMSSGPERTHLLATLAGSLRALVSQADFSSREVNAYLQSQDEGQRQVGLAFVESARDNAYFEPVLQIIGHPSSAFEQYRALRAMEKINPLALNKAQKARLRQVLDEQRAYDPEKKRWIEPDSDRDVLCARLLANIQPCQDFQRSNPPNGRIEQAGRLNLSKNQVS